MSHPIRHRLLSLGIGLALMGASLPAHGLIKVSEVTWLKNPAWKIEGAANGTFYFESGNPGGKTGFSSAVDQEGKDWIYNNGNDTSDGNNHEFRGFPNMGDDNFNHPQRDSKSTSSWKGGKMEGESLVLESSNPNYKVEYHFFSSHITLKVIEAKAPYSFLSRVQSAANTSRESTGAWGNPTLNRASSARFPTKR